jgi:hypothetical protein
MLNTISTTTADAAGYVELDVLPDSSEGDILRRVNRVATLDGGVVVNDNGYSEADRTLELAWQPLTVAQEASVVRLLQSYARLQVSTRSGVFLAAPETYSPGADESTLRLLVIEKLSA